MGLFYSLGLITIDGTGTGLRDDAEITLLIAEMVGRLTAFILFFSSIAIALYISISIAFLAGFWSEVTAARWPLQLRLYQQVTISINTLLKKSTPCDYEHLVDSHRVQRR